ncbi:MAG TPA: hypothetical protein VF121_00035 [Thermoanaerobaculia bacterium]|nr:hypothetical protein [Thermoanaerobaculia bacterium]
MTLHVISGDCAAERLREAGLAGEVLAWRDSPAVGPAPASAPAERRALRAAFWQVGEDELQDIGELAARANGDETVFWFDGCPWDQAMLAELLAAGNGGGPQSLIQVGEHPEVPGYAGLGQLSPAQLAAFYPERQPVTPAQRELAAAAWSALGADDPRPLAKLLAADTSALPYLKFALTRLLEELPSTANGLSRTEEQVLRAVAGGAHRFPDLLRAVAAMERPNHGLWFGDRVLALTLRALASAPAPALAADAVALTPFGEALLAGRADWVRDHGVDRWRGGVRLAGRGPVWRWDPAARRPILA